MAQKTMQGLTPTITIIVPDAVDLTEAAHVYVSFKQGGLVWEKTEGITVAAHAVDVYLEQADTQTSAAKSHTTNTTPIDPFGEIKYYGTTTALNAGDLPSKTVQWQQYVVTLGYSFNAANAALTLTVNKPVYITATPQADGSAVLDYFTQDRPTTRDGKIYILLGVADTATTVEMTIKHPVYYHDGTGIRLWTGG